ncbi:MAG: hypothetical protein K2X81_21705 [Candidatus Obscuribacterales bacterium]|nr:hypothetical protein [Candidatus Obscuribacterales bacterium]
MPWLPCYLSGSDINLILAFLNESKDIAFIVPDGDGKWKAISEVQTLTTGRHTLWDSQSGPLPLIRKGGKDAAGQIEDPWAGWKEEMAGVGSPPQPFFGSGHPGIIWLTIGRDSLGTIGLSSFEWIGNYEKGQGNGASPSSEILWQTLNLFAESNAVKVPRGGPKSSFAAEIWAFPEAQERFEGGAKGAFQ